MSKKDIIETLDKLADQAEDLRLTATERLHLMAAANLIARVEEV